MTEWYYADDSRQRQGPFPAQELVDRFRTGSLKADTLVWREGLAQWQPLRDAMQELGLSDPPPAAAPAPAPPPVSDAPIATAPVLATSPAPPTPIEPVRFEPTAAADIVYAGFWKRVAASVIDSVIVGTVGGVIGGIIGGLFGLFLGLGGGSDFGASWIAMQVMVNLLSIALAAAYYGWFHASTQQATLGKQAIGIKVVRSSGERISLARGIGRYFAYLLSSLTLGIGLIMVAFTQRKQALHDMICDTLVVDRWAFTQYPQRQQRELGTVTMVVLAVFGVVLVVAVMAMVLLLGILASSLGSHH